MANTVATYRRMLAEVAQLEEADLRALGSRVGAGLAAAFPDLVEEIDGLAAGAGQPVEVLLAVNARTELLGGRGAGECTVIAGGEPAAGTLAQTWDWHPDLRASRVVWTVVAPDGRWHATLTEAGIVAKVGLNRDGLAVGLNFLTCSVDGGVGGIPIHVLLRAVLDRCASMTEALDLLTAAAVTASSSVTVLDGGPGGSTVAAVELSPGGAAIVVPHDGAALVHANHFLRPPRRGVDTQPDEHPSTLLRQTVVERELRAGVEPLAALRAHLPRSESVCRHPDPDAAWAERRGTLAAVELRPAVPRFRITDGPPCTASPLEVELPR